jgi:hypothetical protein
MTFAFCCKSYRLADAMLAVTSVFSVVLEKLAANGATFGGRAKDGAFGCDWPAVGRGGS